MNHVAQKYLVNPMTFERVETPLSDDLSPALIFFPLKQIFRDAQDAWLISDYLVGDIHNRVADKYLLNKN